jgi:hypothetical protein
VRRYAVQVEEEVSQAQVEDSVSEEKDDSLFVHYAFEPIATVKIVGVNDLHQHSVDREQNGYSLHNGFPLHAVTYELNGKAHQETDAQFRVVNGVHLPPFNGKAAMKSNGRSRPISKEHNGKLQPAANGQSVSFDKDDIPSVLVYDDSQTFQDNDIKSENEDDTPTVRKLWQRRHARSIEEGVRCEKTREKTTQLSKILSKAPFVPPKRGYFARTISGLINALAEEAEGLEVDVIAEEDSPIWRKKVDTIRINFSRLGFKPLRMGGLDDAIRSLEMELPDSRVNQIAQDLELAAVSSADEAFDRIDEDKSGALDSEEIARALNMAASSDANAKEVLEGLASQIVELYDFNGDGVVDREEYENLVADMATLRREEQERLSRQDDDSSSAANGFFAKTWRWIRRGNDALEIDEIVDVGDKEDEFVDISEDEFSEKADPSMDVKAPNEEKYKSAKELINVSNDAAVESVAKRGGSIILEDLKLDLRQLVFGVVPIVKRVTPGGPLILEPFTATIKGSFSTEDIKASILLDMGLRRLVARALRRRVRSFRDLMDGAVFYGRTWNLASKSAPMVEVPELTSVEFDDKNRMIITGRAQVRASPDAPFIENSFKVRTKIGTRMDGQCIRLEQPELAFVLECPKSFEKAMRIFVGSTGLPMPGRPKPLYSFFPIYSPFKVNDDDGFNMGEDNRIKSIEIKDGALQFELSAVLRPGRFLGSHYLAFTLPMRTFIITMARVREGIRTARQNKRAAEAKARLQKTTEQKSKSRSYLDVVAQSLSSQELVSDRERFQFSDSRKGRKMVDIGKKKLPPNKSFFSRFVDGYLGSKPDGSEHHQRLTSAISDWFGRQSSKNEDDESTKAPTPRRRQAV